jgi:hypothetical protein
MTLTDAARSEQSISEGMMIIDNDVPCVLHLHKRTVEKILCMVMLMSLHDKDKTNAARLHHVERMSNWLN